MGGRATGWWEACRTAELDFRDACKLASLAAQQRWSLLFSRPFAARCTARYPASKLADGVSSRNAPGTHGCKANARSTACLFRSYPFRERPILAAVGNIFKIRGWLSRS